MDARQRGAGPWWASLLLGGFVVGTGCSEPAPFVCAADGDCRLADGAGRCEPNAYCSYDDATCDPGRRWGPYAGDGLADGCSTRIELSAAFAGCAGPSTRHDVCRSNAGGGIDVDLLDGDTSERSVGYLIFDLSGVSDGAVVLQAQLELTVADSATVDSEGGQVVFVEAFVPEELGDEDLGRPLPMSLPDVLPSSAQGPVAEGQTVTWELDGGALNLSERLYLALEPGSEHNVRYWGSGTAAPPRLSLELSR